MFVQIETSEGVRYLLNVASIDGLRKSGDFWTIASPGVTFAEYFSEEQIAPLLAAIRQVSAPTVHATASPQ